MKILFYSDTHFGLARRENVTEASLRAREEYALKYVSQLTKGYDVSVCLGDLFDRTSNKEEVIINVADAISSTSYVMAGNHDIVNKEGAVSSLHILKEIHRDKILMTTVVKNVEQTVRLHVVPHKKTQEEFNKSLEQFISSEKLDGVTDFLLLHCNYNNSFSDKEHELNLSAGTAENLLRRFDTILIGHEHAAKDLLGGRLRIVGSLFPTSFGDAFERHRALVYNTDTKTFKSLDTQNNSYKGPASKFSKDPSNGYILLEDDLGLGGASRLAVELFERGAFAVKVVPRGTNMSKPQETRPEQKSINLPETITAFLNKEQPGLVGIWNEFLSSRATK